MSNTSGGSQPNAWSQARARAAQSELPPASLDTPPASAPNSGVRRPPAARQRPVGPPPPSNGRLVSIDVFRGIVMFLMLAECLHLCQLSESHPDNQVLELLCYHQSHVAWRGCSLHDLIQPAFTFLVGVSLPFSLAVRRRRGQSLLWMSVHAFWRAAILVGLGIFLRSIGQPQTNYTFEDTLTQIGLGYGILFLLGLCGSRVQWTAFAIILVGYFVAFAVFPLPDRDFNWASTGTTEEWTHHEEGFAAHWNKNTNVAWEFDRWFLNCFPRQESFEYNSGGYATLSCIPTLATMILGLLAGGWLRNSPGRVGRLFSLATCGSLFLVFGLFLDLLGICPNVKRIWTPSWVLFSGGCCLLAMATLHLMVDWKQTRRLFVPVALIGMNSIAAYCMSWMFAGFIQQSIQTHVPERYRTILGSSYEPLIVGGIQLLVIWLILAWMYRRKYFIRI